MAYMITIPPWNADQAATVQALAAIAALVVATVGIIVAIGVPWWQRHKARKDDKEDRAKELAGIRQALHTEVGMIAHQCMLELQSWLDTAPPPAVKNIRTARLPPLAFVAANSSKVSLLTRTEIINLIGFSGTLKDIDVVVSDMAQKQQQSEYDRQAIEVMLSNACGNAAKFLEAVPDIEGGDKDIPFINALKAAHKRMEGARMPVQSISMSLFLEPFKAAAAEGAVVELKLRLLAGSIPALQKYAHEPQLKGIETELIKHFDSSLSAEEKDIFRLCRELRNKVLHADFHAARERLNDLGIPTSSGEVKKVDIPVVSVAEIAKKIQGVKAGTEGIDVAATTSTASGTVYGWFLEAGSSGDFQKAADAFKRATAIIERLASIENAQP